MDGTYHSGEQYVQKTVGEQLAANANGRVITDSIVRGAIGFIEKLPMAIVSSIDTEEQIWVSILLGGFGFTKVPNEHLIIFERQLIYSDCDDIFHSNIRVNKEIGSLFIELSSRRRFRINGTVISNGTAIEVSVREAYPNCPQYIQRRVISLAEHVAQTNSLHITGEELNEEAKRWIASADTMFVGSKSKEGRLDASHRGGQPGFIEVLDNNTLKIPDYHGNSMYNTLGNFVENPNAGLLFVDFAKGATLQLTGTATLLFGQLSPKDLEKTTGTGRYWLFKTDKWIMTAKHHQVSWEFIDYSPFNPIVYV
jgi:predicted pyridoxine 5'-phosphate oxidase superfamily flavin-nucleotide-binding protein